MAINFPASPSTNDTHTEGNNRWVWNGSSWTKLSSNAVTDYVLLSDESTDTTCFPIFATSATGSNTPKTGSNLTFNSNTGVLTSDGFNVADSKKVQVGSSQDLSIYHSGSHSYIKHNGTGNLYTDIGVGDQYSITVAESAHCADFVGGGAVTLRYNGNAKLATTNTGVSVTGAITASQGGTITGNTQFNGAVDIGDDNGSNNYRVRLGASQDLSLWHDGTNSYVSNTTGDLFVQTAASKAVYIRPNNGVNGIICHPAGAVDLYHDATKKFSTTSSGAALDSLGATTTLEIISDTESSIDFNDHGGSAKRYKVATNISDNSSQFEIKDMTSNLERLRITSAGDVGIGYNSPTVKLHVREGASGASSYDNRYHMICENNGEAYLGFYVPNNQYAGIRFNDNTGLEGYIDYYFNTDEMLYSSTAIHRWTAAGSERLRITSDGKVGINRTTPAAPITARRLDAGGTGTSGVIAEFANSSGYGVWFGQSSASGASWGATTGDFYWCTGGLSSQTERLRINSSGYVGIKRSTPLANLHVTNNELAIGANPTSAAAPNATYDGLVVDGEAGSFINIRSRGDGNSSYGRLAFSDNERSRGLSLIHI